MYNHISRLTGTAHAYHEHGVLFFFTRPQAPWTNATNRWSNRAGAGAPTPRGGRGEQKATPIQCKLLLGQHSAEHGAAVGDDRSVHPPTRSAPTSAIDSFHELCWLPRDLCLTNKYCTYQINIIKFIKKCISEYIYLVLQRNLDIKHEPHTLYYYKETVAGNC
jgi:hypothetical protein